MIRFFQTFAAELRFNRVLRELCRGAVFTPEMFEVAVKPPSKDWLIKEVAWNIALGKISPTYQRIVQGVIVAEVDMITKMPYGTDIVKEVTVEYRKGPRL